MVVTIVLILLFIETRSSSRKGYNVAVSTDETAIGAEVLLDGKLCGRVEDGKEQNASGGVFWFKAPGGKHELTVRKDAQTTLSKEFEVNGKEYLRFDLGSNDSGKSESSTDGDDAEDGSDSLL